MNNIKSLKFCKIFFSLLHLNVPCFGVETEVGRCFDELENCSKLVAENGCDWKDSNLETALDMLTFCRVSCRNFFGNTSQISEELELLGGVEDSIQNVFGRRFINFSQK